MFHKISAAKYNKCSILVKKNNWIKVAESACGSIHLSCGIHGVSVVVDNNPINTVIS